VVAEGSPPPSLFSETFSFQVAALLILVTFMKRSHRRRQSLGMTHQSPSAYATAQIVPVLSVNEAAAVLGIERSTVYRLLRAGELEAVRVGSRKKFRPRDIEAYLERDREAEP
jgi:excisionase family DNA binding protein